MNKGIDLSGDYMGSLICWKLWRWCEHTLDYSLGIDIELPLPQSKLAADEQPSLCSSPGKASIPYLRVR